MILIVMFNWPAGCSNGNAGVAGTEELLFNFQIVQIRFSVANGSHHCDISSKGAVLRKCNDTEMVSSIR